MDGTETRGTHRETCSVSEVDGETVEKLKTSRKFISYLHYC